MNDPKDYLLIAHRGERVLSPENTLEACKLALKQGATGLEVDVRLCQSGEMVLLHDSLLYKHFRKIKPVAMSPLRALKSLHFASGNYHYPGGICTMEEFLEEFRGTVPINLDAKFWGTNPFRFAKNIVNLVDRLKIRDQVWISSFNPFLLRQLKNIKPTVRTGYLFQDPVRFYQMIDPFLDSDAWHPHYKNATPQLIEKAHRLNKEIYIWTVNTEAVMKRINGFEFHGIISDTLFRTRPFSLNSRPDIEVKKANQPGKK